MDSQKHCKVLLGEKNIRKIFKIVTPKTQPHTKHKKTSSKP